MDVVFTLRLTVEERDGIAAAADWAGQKPTLWARDALLRAAAEKS